MLLTLLLLVPIIGIFFIVGTFSYENNEKITYYKNIALITSIVNLIISLIVYILFDSNTNQFQFSLFESDYDYSFVNLSFAVDGISIYFILLTTFIFPIAFLADWNSINTNIKAYTIILLLLETLLISTFLATDMLLFYIFFESLSPPLFLLVGLYGSGNKTRASFYLFLYTLFGSLFMLLVILSIGSLVGTTDFSVVYQSNIDFNLQLVFFIGLFISFAIKTPLYGVHNWLLKAHVEAPLSGSILLAALVLKFSVYGFIRLVLPVLPKASLYLSPFVYVICAITVIYAAISTLRTTDLKELIAYSSVGHAAIYVLGVFSNTIPGIEGAILLSLGHGFVSSGLFICTGGILYNRTGTKSILFYRGITQIMPLLSIFFFILCLANCGTPLTLNFVGEFLSLYGAFEKLPLIGMFGATSIVLSAAYTIYMYNRVFFGGILSPYFKENMLDLTKREFFILFILVFLTILLGIYPSFILDGLHFNVSNLIYSSNTEVSSMVSSCVIPNGTRSYSTLSK